MMTIGQTDGDSVKSQGGGDFFNGLCPIKLSKQLSYWNVMQICPIFNWSFAKEAFSDVNADHSLRIVPEVEDVTCRMRASKSMPPPSIVRSFALCYYSGHLCVPVLPRPTKIGSTSERGLPDPFHPSDL